MRVYLSKPGYELKVEEMDKKVMPLVSKSQVPELIDLMNSLRAACDRATPNSGDSENQRLCFLLAKLDEHLVSLNGSHIPNYCVTACKFLRCGDWENGLRYLAQAIGSGETEESISNTFQSEQIIINLIWPDFNTVLELKRGFLTTFKGSQGVQRVKNQIRDTLFEAE